MTRLLLAILTALCLTTALLLAAAWQPGAAQSSGIEVTDMQATYEFGTSITFTARLVSDQPIETVVLFFQAQNDTHTTLGLGSLVVQPDGSTQLSYVHKMESYNLRAFSDVDYHWEVTPKGGEVYRSPHARFYYRDNRFAWNSLEEGEHFRVFWYDGNLQFGLDVLDTAQQGLLQVQKLLPMPAPSGLALYVYADSNAMQATLHPSSAEWVAGHADPDLGVIVVSLPPGPDQKLLTQQRVPHELMHILLYQTTDLGYTNLPTWLNEGLASLAELYPNSDYRLLLEDAVQRDALIPMTSLCQTFPRDASGAILAYAQSTSFVQYLRDMYGVSGLQSLLAAYANGLDCERGAQKALGRSLTQLERDWRRDALAEDTTAAVANNLLPWLILLGAAMAAPAILMARRWQVRSLRKPA